MGIWKAISQCKVHCLCTDDDHPPETASADPTASRLSNLHVISSPHLGISLSIYNCSLSLLYLEKFHSQSKGQSPSLAFKNYHDLDPVMFSNLNSYYSRGIHHNPNDFISLSKILCACTLVGGALFPVYMPLLRIRPCLETSSPIWTPIILSG